MVNLVRDMKLKRFTVLVLNLMKKIDISLSDTGKMS